MSKKIQTLVFACALVCIAGCDHKKKATAKAQMHVVTASMQTPVRQLFFSGALAPISTVTVESPVAGIVTVLGFNYGERVVDKQKLLSISSHELAENYRKTVSDFLQKKQAYQTQKTSFIGEEALYKAGVVSQSDYQSNKGQYENATLSFLQAQYDLEKVLRTANVDPKEIEALSLSETNRVNLILQRHFHDVDVFAPKAGVALYPQPKSSSDGSSTDGKLSVGAIVKDGQLLLSIGDLSGLSATFDVSEVDINRIKKGMSVIVTGSAFPGETLQGIVNSVSAQANQGNGGGGGGLSMFTVGIDIPKISPAAMARIRVGMTAKFEIDIHSAPQLMLPVNAVFQDKGQNVVRLVGANGQEQIVPVVTGDTTPTDVVIISGVKAGDKVAIEPLALP